MQPAPDSDRPRTVFITGCSSGIGKAAALLFAKNGWNVVATMRRPEAEQDIVASDTVLLLQLDVTDESSIQKAVDMAIKRFGAIDVLVNNAGYGLLGPLEAATSSQLTEQFNTNVLGLALTTKIVIPHMRRARSGTIINVSSMIGRVSLPFFSPYAASKWAVEGLSESLAYELRPFNIAVRIVEPGPIKTNFFQSEQIAKDAALTDYDAHFVRVMKSVDSRAEHGAPVTAVTQAIWRAAHHPGQRLRYPVGSGARALMALHRLLPNRLYMAIVRKFVG